MARYRPVDPPSSRSDRQPMVHKGEAAMQTDEYGEDPWALAVSRDVCRKSTAKTLAAHEPIKNDSEPEDEVALPTPIAQGAWKVTAPDGREELTYQPIPGFEHLLYSCGLSQGLPYHQSAIGYQQPHQQAAASQASVIQHQQKAAAPKRKSLKRNRSVARGQAKHRAQAPVDDDEDDYDNDDDVRAINETSYTFYIGDLVELTRFFRRRLEELTMKPLRPIVTAWIKQLEPRRLGAYGPYHKQLPSQQPPECTPPWWPGEVPYEEPSHLDKTGLLKLAVDVMLQHRLIDEPKRKGSWVAKLRQAAQYAIETTPPEQFSSSKGSGFSELMRERALNEIMPTLFDIAQSYEDHFAQYNLYEGSGNSDPQNGRTCTWQIASRPPRQPLHRKRMRRARASPPVQADSEVEVSADDTEVDDSVSNTYLRREQVRSRNQARTPKSSTNTVATPRRQSRRTPPRIGVAHTPAASQSGMSTPNGSFDRNMSGLCLGGDADTDVKSVNHAQYADQQAVMCNMYALNQPMQYPPVQANYNEHAYPIQEHVGSYSNPAQPSYVASTGPGFIPYPMYNTPYPPQIDNSAFPSPMGHNHAGFPYECESVYPVVSASGPANTSFHGLPVEFVVDSHGSARH